MGTVFILLLQLPIFPMSSPQMLPILPDNNADFEMSPQSRKARRIYQRMLTGLGIAKNFERDMRFLTLTTAPERRYSKRKIKDKHGNPILNAYGKPTWELVERTPKDSFDILRARIKRATVLKDGFTGFNLNKYYCLRTSEGNGVLHIIFWGGLYIPVNWLRTNWYEIHGAYEADIRYVHRLKKTITGLVGYLIDNYLLNQPIERMSYGWGWAWLGYCKSWKHIKNEYRSLRRGKGELRQSMPTSYQPWEQGHSCRQAVPFWKGVLWNPPKTSRKTSFFTDKRGFNPKYFELDT